MARTGTLLSAKLTRCAAALSIVLTTAGAAPASVFAIHTQQQHADGIVAQRPCPLGSEFTCMSLLVPLDHAAPGGSERLTVVFARLPARDIARRRGVLVTAVGGPGTSGIYAADSYAEAFGPAIRDAFDLVFFDMRGIGLSGNLRCDNAVTKYLQTESRSTTPDQEARTIAHARAFAAACQSQLGDAGQLRHYNSRQAVADLEVMRQALGESKLWLYGESYGTQLAQWYAAAHPTHVAGLILDSPVDLSLNGPQFTRAQAHAFDATLQRALAACDTDTACQADFAGTRGAATAAYDALAATLAAEPVSFAFRHTDGAAERREFTLGALETAATTYLYTAADRTLFLRALAYANRGELQPIAMLFYTAVGVSPHTLATQPDPGYSDAAYYTVNCNDYPYFSGPAEERARRYMESGDAIDGEVARVESVYYGELPCAFWPLARQEAPPTRAHAVPTLLLVSTVDPATPFEQASALFKRLKNAAMIVQEAGPHVMFARGDSCIDSKVSRFLLQGVLPEQRESACAGQLLDRYAPAMKPAYDRYDDALDAFIAVERELTQNPGYVAWSRGNRHSEACLLGGAQRIDYSGRQNSDLFELTRCTLTSGLAITGAGRRALDKQVFTLKAELTGDSSGTIEYTHVNGVYRLSGQIDGNRVLLERTDPR